LGIVDQHACAIPPTTRDTSFLSHTNATVQVAVVLVAFTTVAKPEGGTMLFPKK